MSAPRLSVPLVLETARRLPDGMGGYRRQWQALGVVYAAMKAGAGAATEGETGPQSTVVWRITLRAAPEGDPRRPRPGQRLRMGARIFAIEAVAEADGPGLWLVCMAREEKQG